MALFAWVGVLLATLALACVRDPRRFGWPERVATALLVACVAGAWGWLLAGDMESALGQAMACVLFAFYLAFQCLHEPVVSRPLVWALGVLVMGASVGWALIAPFAAPALSLTAMGLGSYLARRARLDGGAATWMFYLPATSAGLGSLKHHPFSEYLVVGGVVFVFWSLEVWIGSPPKPKRVPPSRRSPNGSGTFDGSPRWPWQVVHSEGVPGPDTWYGRTYPPRERGP